VLRWATEIDRVDILLEVSLLSQYQASPREGHLKQLHHIFASVRKHPKLTLYMSPEIPMMDFGALQTQKGDFMELYCDAEEQLSLRMPAPRGRSFTMALFLSFLSYREYDSFYLQGQAFET
jgi:hypothetical protein